METPLQEHNIKKCNSNCRFIKTKNKLENDIYTIQYINRNKMLIQIEERLDKDAIIKIKFQLPSFNFFELKLPLPPKYLNIKVPKEFEKFGTFEIEEASDVDDIDMPIIKMTIFRNMFYDFCKEFKEYVDNKEIDYEILSVNLRTYENYIGGNSKGKSSKSKTKLSSKRKKNKKRKRTKKRYRTRRTKH